ncbi:MAG: hydantoinase B/oxoprolinase family protein [Armatimonadetes bacterium]|nr:hydantoinase B/oxoprolinase family protein [Armatimonadota bacterium]
MSTTTTMFDAVTVQVLWNRLTSVADEMAVTLQRTSFSTVVAGANDFGCEILDGEGNALVHATRSMPAFNAAMSTAVKGVLKAFPRETIRPGDVFVTNDPWLCAGHLGDIMVATPIFSAGEVTGFAVSMAHTSDIGGTLNATGSREVFEEGLRIPLCRLFTEGRLDETVVAFIGANVRTPDMVIGDVYAQLGANELAVRGVGRLMEEYGLEDLTPLARTIQGHAERRMRGAIATVPDGEYACDLMTEGLQTPVRLRVRVTVAGDTMTVDYAGTDPQYRDGAINVVYNMTYASTVYVLACLLTPDIPNNHGSTRPIAVTAPEGCILNAQFPAAVDVRTRVSNFLHALLCGALADVLPDRVHADCGIRTAMVANGVDTRAGRRFNAWIFCGGGMGATGHGDGPSCRLFPTSASNVPVEIVENRSPLVIESKELIADSGGAGTHRGGLGQRIALRLHPHQREAIVLTLWPDMLRYPPRGLKGGRPGKGSRAAFNGHPLRRLSPAMIRGSLDIAPDDHLLLEIPGGGGFGPPKGRDPAAAARDVTLGYVTPPHAARVYGRRNRTTPQRRKGDHE